MRFPFFKPKSFEPDFPIIPLYATEDEARKLLGQYSAVSEEARLGCISASLARRGCALR